MSNRDAIERYYAAWNRGDEADLRRHLAPDLDGQSAEDLRFGVDDLVNFRRMLDDEFDRLEVHAIDLVEAGDRIATRWRTVGHKSSTSVVWEGATFYRVRDGIIAHIWDLASPRRAIA